MGHRSSAASGAHGCCRDKIDSRVSAAGVTRTVITIFPQPERKKWEKVTNTGQRLYFRHLRPKSRLQCLIARIHPRTFPGCLGGFPFRPNSVENILMRRNSDRTRRQSLSGLRTTAEAISRLPGHTEVGPLLRNLLVALGSGRVPEAEPEDAVIELDDFLSPVRRKLAQHSSCSDHGPVRNEDCDTDIWAEHVRRWATAARDPGVEVGDWLTRGAHAGTTADLHGADDIFLGLMKRASTTSRPRITPRHTPTKI